MRKDAKVDIQRTRNKLTGPKKQNSYILIRKNVMDVHHFHSRYSLQDHFEAEFVVFFFISNNKFLGFFWGILGDFSLETYLCPFSRCFFSSSSEKSLARKDKGGALSNHQAWGHLDGDIHANWRVDIDDNPGRGGWMERV